MQTNYNRDKIHGKTDRSTNDRNDTGDLEEEKKKKETMIEKWNEKLMVENAEKKVDE